MGRHHIVIIIIRQIQSRPLNEGSRTCGENRSKCKTWCKGDDRKVGCPQGYDPPAVKDRPHIIIIIIIQWVGTTIIHYSSV